MLPTNPFSFLEYQRIIERLRKTTTIIDYAEVSPELDEYCVIRHDVEFTVERAFELAQFESEELNLTSSYLFQLRNNCYNLCSDINIKTLYKIKAMGHNIGLHLHFGLLNNTQEIQVYIMQEAELFQRLTGLKINRFSYHRPPAEILKQYFKVDNLINCYDKDFFHFYDQPHQDLPVKYYTDSRHYWQHGHPIDNTAKKVQLLTHPFSWTREGYNNSDNFTAIMREKQKLMAQSMNKETSTFPQSLLK